MTQPSTPDPLAILPSRPRGSAPSTSAVPRGVALLALGFRPFYLLAALYAVLAVPMWVARAFGAWPFAMYAMSVHWHAHEMLFGFAAAVIVGFLFTAARNWTGLPTPRGLALALLVALWAAARVLNVLQISVWAALVDVAFLVIAALLLARVLWKARNHRNLFVVALLLALATANALWHLSLLGMVALAPQRSVYAALFLVVMLECVMAGRVVPMFTTNAIAGLKTLRHEQLDALTIGATGAAFLLVLGEAAPALTATICTIAALLHVVRWLGWRPFATLGKPILWILHVSYAWIPAGLLLLAAGVLGKAPTIAAFHALAIGSMGGLIIGMITRTALGHTGRPLHAGRMETAAYVLVHASALLRLAPLLFSALPYTALLVAAAICWSLAFVLYLVKYAPYLVRARVDGREG